MDAVICPHCKKTFEPSEAIIRHFEQQAQEKNKIDMKEFRSKVETETKEKMEVEIKDAKNETEEYKKRQSEMKQQVLEANEKVRLLKIKEDEREIENQKWKMQEREIMKSEISKLEQGKAGVERQKIELENRELKIQLDSMKKAVEEANKKGGSKSQQLQGEALELETFDILVKSFPLDEIVEIKKGVFGGDIRHVVKSPKGFSCGSILWECKRTKWDEKKFIEKLKLDQRTENLNLAVIVSTNLPKDAADGFINRGDDIWICSLSLIIPLAVALRKMLLDAAYQRALAINRGEKKEDLFSYITSTGFIQPVRTIVEVYKEMTSQIVNERNAYEKIWKQRESQAQRIINSMANIVGNIQGKIGASALQIKELDLIESGSNGKP